MIRVNKTYYEMMGYKDVSDFREHSLDILNQIYQPDRERFLEACRNAASSGMVQKLTVSRYRYEGTLPRFDCSIKHVGGTAERPLLCVSIVDASDRLLAERENELNKYCDALYSVFDEIYEFNYEEDSFRVVYRNHVRCNEKTEKLTEVEKNWFENLIYFEDRDKIRKYIIEARAGTISLPFNTDYRIVSEGKIRWKTASLVSLAGGGYLICRRDITKEKQLELFMGSYESELRAL